MVRARSCIVTRRSPGDEAQELVRWYMLIQQGNTSIQNLLKHGAFIGCEIERELRPRHLAKELSIPLVE